MSQKSQISQIRIVKDGSIQGWFVSLCITANIMILLTLGFFLPSVHQGWKDFGPTAATIYLGQFASWLAFKSVSGVLTAKGKLPDPGEANGGIAGKEDHPPM